MLPKRPQRVRHVDQHFSRFEAFPRSGQTCEFNLISDRLTIVPAKTEIHTGKGTCTSVDFRLNYSKRFGFRTSYRSESLGSENSKGYRYAHSAATPAPFKVDSTNGNPLACGLTIHFDPVNSPHGGISGRVNRWLPLSEPNSIIDIFTRTSESYCSESAPNLCETFDIGTASSLHSIAKIGRTGPILR